LADQTQRFLIVGPAWVGDMVLAQSLFKVLKQRHPDSTLDVLAPRWTLPLLERMPEVDEAIAMDIRHGELRLGERLRLGRELRARHYDRAIVCQLAQIRDRPACRGVRALRPGLSANCATACSATSASSTSKNFRAPWIDSSRSASSRARRCRNSSAANPGGHGQGAHGAGTPGSQPAGGAGAGLCPGAEYGPAKRWPAEYFADVAQAKLAEAGSVAVRFGQRRARDRRDQSMTGKRCLDLGGKTTLEKRSICCR
jgi:heptosyltransferase-2